MSILPLPNSPFSPVPKPETRNIGWLNENVFKVPRFVGHEIKYLTI